MSLGVANGPLTAAAPAFPVRCRLHSRVAGPGSPLRLEQPLPGGPTRTGLLAVIRWQLAAGEKEQQEQIERLTKQALDL